MKQPTPFRKYTLALIALFAITLLAAFATRRPPEALAGPTLPARLFEMRTYYTHTGKLSHLHDRFRNHTNYLFVKHGMTLIGYWTPEDKEDTLVYILGFPNQEARKKSFQDFGNDPEWKRVYAESHKSAGGPIVQKIDSQFLTPTNYSPIR